MQDFLTAIVIVAGGFTALMIMWLIHVAHREAHLFRLHWLGNPKLNADYAEYGAGYSDDLLPVERRENAYLKQH